MAKNIKITTVSLLPDDIKNLAFIRKKYGGISTTGAVRFAIHHYSEYLREMKKRGY